MSQNVEDHGVGGGVILRPFQNQLSGSCASELGWNSMIELYCVWNWLTEAHEAVSSRSQLFQLCKSHCPSHRTHTNNKWSSTSR